MKELSKSFYLSSFAVSVVGTILLIISYLTVFRMLISPGGSGNAPESTHTAASGSSLLAVIGVLGLLYSSIVVLTLIYQMWQSIQDGHARTTPGKAVGFLFIPFFNFYWVFQALWGFSKDYNSYSQRKGLAVTRLPEGWFLAWSILTFFTWIPFAGLIAYWVVGFLVVWKICDAVNALADAGANEQARALFLYCLSGEFAHDTVEIPLSGLYIGRDPAKANLVLGSNEVSGVHARVWSEPGGSQVWVEDQNSLNGTYYRADGEASPSQWVQLKGKVPMSGGARFRLGDDIAEFEVRISSTSATA